MSTPQYPSSSTVPLLVPCMVCAHCGSESHYAGDSNFAEYGTLSKEAGHRQKRANCRCRVCSKCGTPGHSATECTQIGCSECGCTTHKRAMSAACPAQVHQLPRHARTEACGPRKVANYNPAICIPNKCALCVMARKNQQFTTNTICPRAECQTCKLFGHVTKDCAYANCLDVDDDWFNVLLAA